MQINRISGFFGKNFYNSNVNFNGHFRSVEVKALNKDVFQARVAGSDSDSGNCKGIDEAVYFAIRNSDDYVRNNKIEKLKDIVFKDNGTKSVGEIYFTDENEDIYLDNIEPYADYIVYADNAGIIIL